MPSSRQARITRTAISPRFAIRSRPIWRPIPGPLARGTPPAPPGPRRRAHRGDRDAGRSGSASAAVASRTRRFDSAIATGRRPGADRPPRRRPRRARRRGRTLCTRPIRRASSASKRRPLVNSARACAGADRAQHVGRDRGRDQAQPGLGEPERRVLGRRSRRRRTATSPAPPPSAGPLHPGDDRLRAARRWPPTCGARDGGVGDVLVLARASRLRRIHSRSAPAQNALPAPVRTITRVSSHRQRRGTSWVSSMISSGPSAFRALRPVEGQRHHRPVSCQA